MPCLERIREDRKKLRRKEVHQGLDLKTAAKATGNALASWLRTLCHFIAAGLSLYYLRSVVVKILSWVLIVAAGHISFLLRALAPVMNVKEAQFFKICGCGILVRRSGNTTRSIETRIITLVWGVVVRVGT